MQALTDNREVRHVGGGPRQTQHVGDNQPNDPKDKRARPMVGERVHCHGESKQVASHDKDDEDQLAHSEELAAELASQHFSGISHALDMGVRPAELPYHVACVGRHDTDCREDDDSPET